MANEYDFIMNNQPQRRKIPNLVGPQKLLAIIALFAGVIVLLIIIFSLVFSSTSGGNKQSLANIIAYQTEVTRVIDLGIDDVDDQSLKQYLQTINAVVVSDLQEADSIAASKDYKIEKIERNAQKDSAVDALIETAVAERELDKVLEENVTLLVNQYIRALNDARSSTNSTLESDLYTESLASIQVIANAE